MTKQNITLGLSEHRPEMIPIISNRMRSHEAVFLEEPPTEGFEQMLAGELAVDEYLRQIDMEYPAFSGEMCYLLQELKADGKQIHQVEPFLQMLLDIHDFFTEGNRPEDLDRKSAHYPVYLAERRATKALLDYYQTAMNGSFEDYACRRYGRTRRFLSREGAAVSRGRWFGCVGFGQRGCAGLDCRFRYGRRTPARRCNGRRG